MEATREQIGWLRTLISSHKELMAQISQIETGDRGDEDPDATLEMHLECERLADVLDARLDLAEPRAEDTVPVGEPVNPDDIPF